MLFFPRWQGRPYKKGKGCRIWEAQGKHSPCGRPGGYIRPSAPRFHRKWWEKPCCPGLRRAGPGRSLSLIHIRQLLQPGNRKERVFGILILENHPQLFHGDDPRSGSQADLGHQRIGDGKKAQKIRNLHDFYAHRIGASVFTVHLCVHPDFLMGRL